MIVLDTHVFIWWVSNRAKLSRPARRAIENAQRVWLSGITLWEIAKLVAHRRLKVDRDVEAWLEDAIEATRVEVVAIDAAIAVRSTRLASQFHGDPADQLIAATAIEMGAVLVTSDEKLLVSRAVRTLW